MRRSIGKAVRKGARSDSQEHGCLLQEMPIKRKSVSLPNNAWLELSDSEIEELIDERTQVKKIRNLARAVRFAMS
jgi:hypothetical protein